jgi:hypothetical protein
MALSVLAVLGVLSIFAEPGVAPDGLPDQAEALGAEGDRTSGRLLRARMEADLARGTDQVTVTLEYQVAAGPDALSIPLSVLLMDPAVLSPIRAEVDGTPASVALREVRPLYFAGKIALDSGAGPSDSVGITLTYRVTGNPPRAERAVLPLVVPLWEPSNARPQTFQATVRIPAGLSITGSFPTSVLSRPRGDEGGAMVVGLQGVPSVLTLRLATGEPPLLTVERALDGVVVLGLLLMAVVGWRHLRSQP